MNSLNRRVQLHYLLTVAIMAIYGIQVCPFIEGLSPLQLGTPLVLIVILQYLLHRMLWGRGVVAQPLVRQSVAALRLQLLLFLFSGGVLTVSNALVYDFPLGSGLKMILGFIALGFFAALDIALACERQVAETVRQQQLTIDPQRHYFPLVRKFALFAMVTLTLLTGVLFLVVSKDLVWLAQVGESLEMPQAQRAILLELAFTVGILLLYVLQVVRSYSRNLALHFADQNMALARATAGSFDGRVTVSSHDEFGVMGYHTNRMIETLNSRTAELQRTQDVTILTLATLAETRDPETGEHILRTQRYVKALAEQLRQRPEYRSQLDDATIDLLYKSAPLHDIGKVGIPDHILLKPGRLDEEEFAIMRHHAELGGEALGVAERELGSSSFLRYAREIAQSHHEKWDGSGYPEGLQGEAIPLSGRLMAVADVYDALISRRVYKEPFSHDKAMAIIRDGRGTHFDPLLIDILDECEAVFVAIAAAYTQEP
ncbi:MAG: HD domain-containing protein [Gammaproteobacteria bacterium]|nr:HD domain-containing protein [Gammaproteobacteria bacterium]